MTMKLTRFFAATAMALVASSVITAPATAKEKVVNTANNKEFALIGSAPVTNVSPADNGFACFANYLAQDKRRPAFSVGRLSDQTGKFSNEASAGGYAVTQGLSNMVYTALGKMAPDFVILERTDTNIVDNEVALAKQGLIGDATDRGILVTDPKTGEQRLLNVGMRNYRAAQFQGTDYYITGAITEINYNVDSGGAELGVNAVGAGKRVYSMSVAVDLRVVDARTLRVVKTVSERKIIKGYEVKAGVFNFLGIYLIDINAGRKAQEPIDLGVRATMEAALLKLVGAVYQTPYGEQCANFAAQSYGIVPAKADPIGEVLSKN